MSDDRKDDRYNADADEEEEEEDIDETGYKSVKDAVLFAIDVSASMLQPPANQEDKKADKDSATSAALKCAYALMQQRIISNPNDMMGILLFGTEQSKFQDDEDSRGGYQYPHCYLLADLDIPAASDVKRLRDIVEDEEESKKLLVPAKEQVAMANVLFCANQIFTTKAPNFSSRRLFIVTDNDNPHATAKELKSSASVRAKDLYDLGVTIELFPISRPDHEFVRTKFYDDIVYRTNSKDTDQDIDDSAANSSANKAISTGDGISLLQKLLTSINSKAAPKRTQYNNLPLEIAPNLRISVKAYVFFKRQMPARSCYVWLDGDVAQIPTGKSSRIAEDTARTVEKVEIRKAFKFGGENIVFTPEELTSLKHFGEPMVRLVEFKDRKLLPTWANLRPATLLYPSEEDVVGSTRTFAALQKSLLAKKKIGIVWYIARRNAAPVLAALLPSEEKIGEQGEQVIPPGLWIVPLPFADDIRSNPDMATMIESPPALIDEMRNVVQQLQLPKAVYDPSRYPNPSLQWHYRILQALALGEDLPEQPEDKTVPRHRQIHKRAGPYVLDWGRVLEESFREWQQENRSHHEATGQKRAGSTTAASTAKKAKIDADAGGAASIDDNEMELKFNKGKLASFTVAQLKDFIGAKKLGLVSGLKKADLVAMVEGHFEKKKGR